jgi:XTP/dITP diphosphohydrolase
MKLLLGTNNLNKIKQFRKIFENLGSDIELVTLRELNISDDVEEDNDSLLDNAKKKARHYGTVSGILSLADDTGFFVDALNGEPGVHAKRWHQGTEEDRYMKILELTKNVPDKKRTCRYTGVLAIYNPISSTFWTYQNNLEGKIAKKPHAKNGFGYDPIVILTEINKYYSELPSKERNRFSHRGKGIAEFVKMINLKKE